MEGMPQKRKEVTGDDIITLKKHIDTTAAKEREAGHLKREEYTEAIHTKDPITEEKELDALRDEGTQHFQRAEQVSDWAKDTPRVKKNLQIAHKWAEAGAVKKWWEFWK